MKIMRILTTMGCLLLLQTAAVLAQTPDYSGFWELDAGKSVLPDAMAIEKMMLRVQQTEKELKIESTTMTAQDKADEKRRKVGFTTETAVYNLGATDANADGAAAQRKDTGRASVTADGKLNLTVIRNFDTELGSYTTKTNEIWELAEAGKTLKIARYTETPRGATNAELYFTKKPFGTSGIGSSGGIVTSGEGYTGTGVGKISGGVLNGKAIKLPKPTYPAAAAAVRASGAVNVQVTIDEQGNIASASAVSGHPLLRAAAEEAARGAQFAPTLLEGNPVKVTGVIVYNFVP